MISAACPRRGCTRAGPSPYVAPLPLTGTRAPVAQLDRAPDYESGGRRFESFRARHFPFRADIMRRALILTFAALTACSSAGGPYPSLQPRSAEAIDPRLAVVRPMNDRPVTPRLRRSSPRWSDRRASAMPLFSRPRRRPSGSRLPRARRRARAGSPPRRRFRPRSPLENRPRSPRPISTRLPRPPCKPRAGSRPTTSRPRRTRRPKSRRSREARPTASTRSSGGSGLSRRSAAPRRARDRSGRRSLRRA